MLSGALGSDSDFLTTSELRSDVSGVVDGLGTNWNTEAPNANFPRSWRHCSKETRPLKYTRDRQARSARDAIRINEAYVHVIVTLSRGLRPPDSAVEAIVPGPNIHGYVDCSVVAHRGFAPPGPTVRRQID